MMLQFLYKCNYKTQIKSQQLCTAFYNLKNCLNPPHTHGYGTKSITKTKSGNDFTKSYLKNICGLSGKSLIRASNLVSFKSPQNPDSVIQLFKRFGFSQTHITKVISRRPIVLVSDPEKTLKPKLDFLLSVVNSNAQLIRIMVWDPYLLIRSLKCQLIPSFNFLVSLMGSEQNAAAAVKRRPSVLKWDVGNCYLRKVELLQTLGMPHSQILKLIIVQGEPISRSHGKFSQAVLKVKEMGFDVRTSAFINAVMAMISVSGSTWESKFENYRSFGFSNDEIISMFKKQPIIMSLSVEKIRKTLEFFVNRLHWSPSKLSITPGVLLYSLEKRTIPRCSVLQTLASRNVIYRDMSLTTILVMKDEEFLKDYVTKHKKEVPEVLDAYRGKLRFDEYNFHLVGKQQDETL